MRSGLGTKLNNFLILYILNIIYTFWIQNLIFSSKLAMTVSYCCSQWIAASNNMFHHRSGCGQTPRKLQWSFKVQFFSIKNQKLPLVNLKIHMFMLYKLNINQMSIQEKAYITVKLLSQIQKKAVKLFCDPTQNWSTCLKPQKMLYKHSISLKPQIMQ